ncbi:RidA family protein [Gymnodinialimonas ceratoperidinii]|uniref:RidA family protein n=1 Tax=Gymnodinialimonas ceratoperidinii TaxID=2856823 RepID=A0A8F6Y9E3_9RHOB|nr:RidA family protein [Gymnodinialimonas ceratoperidinii]QXT38859.1 RidA family protein [Gymnodinialimonas ceratoperidinii]
MSRQNISSGSYLEPQIGFSRAVRIGNTVAIGGTAPIAAEGGTDCVGDVYGQTKRCLEIALAALSSAGGTAQDVIRTRIILTDIRTYKDAARAHAEVFTDIRPVTTVMEVSAFVDPDWLVEIELDAILKDQK